MRLVFTENVHAHAAYVAAMRDGSLADAAVRRLGFPWSDSLVVRAQRSVGGTHHGLRDRGEGFCVFNDIAVAIAVARRDQPGTPRSPRSMRSSISTCTRARARPRSTRTIPTSSR